MNELPVVGYEAEEDAHLVRARRGRPLYAFANMRTPWTEMRRSQANPETGKHWLFSILKIEPNAVVWPILPKAMPAILTTAAEMMSGCALSDRDPWRYSDRPPMMH